MKKISAFAGAVLAMFFSILHYPLLIARTFLKRPGYVHQDKIQTLFSTPAWKAFKEFWRRVGAVSPRKPARRLAITRAPYAGSLNNAQYKQLNVELDKQIKQLKQAGLPTLDRDFLGNLMRARLKNMRYGPRSMFTRMMPSPNMIEKEKSLQRLEAQIDRLIKLRDKGRITSAEFEMVLKMVQDEVVNISVIHVVVRAYGQFWPGVRNWHSRFQNAELIKRQIDLIEAHFKKMQQYYRKNPQRISPEKRQQMEKKYSQVRKDLVAFRKHVPRLLMMVADLER